MVDIYKDSGKRQGAQAGRAKIALANARRMKALSARVRELRKRRNWSQRGLAAACGLVPGQVGSIERGERNAALTTLLKISVDQCSYQCSSVVRFFVAATRLVKSRAQQAAETACRAR